jgi:hypothetical protein
MLSLPKHEERVLYSTRSILPMTKM